MPEVQARIRERQRRAALTTLTAVLARANGIAVNLLLVPITLSYFGEERFGLWMTVTAFTQMLSFADLGLGNGLMNHISDGYGRDDRDAIRRSVASAFAMLCAIAAVLCAAALVAYPFIDWTPMLKLRSTAAASDAGPAVLVVFVSFVANIPLGVIARIQSGIQEAYETNLFVMLGKTASLAAVFVGIQFELGLPSLLALFLGLPLAATLLNGVRVFRSRHRDLLPRFKDVSRPAAMQLLRLGLQFMLLQACVALVYSSDNVILAHEAGANQVASYSVVDQMFAVPIMLLTMATGPLWPAYTEALARRDHAWVLRTFRQSLAYATTFSVLSSIVLVVCGPVVIRLWTRGLTEPSLSLLLAMGTWNICLGVATSIVMFLNAIGQLRAQVIGSLGMLLVGTGVRVLACRHFGGPGLAWGTSASYVVIALLPVLLETRGRLRELQQASVRAVPQHAMRSQP